MSSDGPAGQSAPLPRRWPACLLMALTATLLAGWTRTAPGYTSDEPFNVLYGKTFVAEFVQKPWFVFDAGDVARVFGPRAEHPPLGRWLIGWTNFLLDPQWRDTTSFDLDKARWAPALCYGLLTALVAWAASSSGRLALWSAGLLLLSLPRLFGHAHFAALELPLTLCYTAALVALMAAVRSRLAYRWVVLAGAAAGLAMLTKIHGFLLLPTAAVCFARYGPKRAALSTSLYALVAGCVWFAGWPWLWYAPVAHTVSFLSSGVARATTYVTYLGTVYADHEVPWHYPWVMLAASMPLPHLVLALAAALWHVYRLRADAEALVPLAGSILPLVLFSIPGVPVYDGIRLFLIVLPAVVWLMVRWLATVAARRFAGAVCLIAVACAVGWYGMVRAAPCWLSYYGELVGGLKGAVRLGLEPTYWGDAVTPGLLTRWSEQAERGATLELVPTLYDRHAELYLTARMMERAQRVVPQGEAADYTLVFRRSAYVPAHVLRRAQSAPVVAEVVVEGVWLSRIVRNGSKRDEPGTAGTAADSFR